MLRQYCGRHFTGITAGAWLLLDQFSEPEVQNLCVTISRNHDVVRLKIAMNDSGSMGFC